MFKKKKNIRSELRFVNNHETNRNGTAPSGQTPKLKSVVDKVREAA
jgi:hypothetical protein